MKNELDKEIAIYDKHVAFWGSPLSNFHKCSFEYNHLTWKSSEQAYMAEKAIYFGDYEMFLKILETNTPAEAKKLGRQVRGFEQDEWNDVSFDIMFHIVWEKFKQNDYLKEYILRDDFKGKGFIEGSPVDGIWGVKVSWDNPEIDNEANWQGENRLGKVLNLVRMYLNNESLLTEDNETE